MVLLWTKVGMFIRIWHLLGKKRENSVWVWWISYIVVLWKLAGHFQNNICWRDIVRVDPKPKSSLKPEKQMKYEAYVLKHVKLCLLQIGWTTNLSFSFLTTMIRKTWKILKDKWRDWKIKRRFHVQLLYLWA